MPLYTRLFALFCLLLWSTSSLRAQAIVPFGSGFAPTFSLTEEYDEGAAYSTEDEEFVVTTTYSLTFDFQASMSGINRTTFDNNSLSLKVLAGNLDVLLPFSEGLRSTSGGMNVVRWYLEGFDPNTFEELARAGTVELRYDGAKVTVSLTLTKAWDDYSITAPDRSQVEGPFASSLPVTFTIGNYGFTDRMAFIRGATVFHDLTVQRAGASETFTDLANVRLTGAIDSTSPAVQITTPAASQSVLSPSLTVRGIATDDHGLASVFLKVNQSDFQPATLNGNGTWSLADITLRPGDNILVARAVDADGNSGFSPAQVVRYVVFGDLVVSAEGTGFGTVNSGFFEPILYDPSQSSPTRSLQRELGEAVIVVATPGQDSVFDGWTSNRPLTVAQATSPRLTFTMEPDVTFTAHFLRSPFTPAVGRYTGLVQSPDPSARGVLTGMLTATGRFTLTAKAGRLRIPVRGQFSNSGEFQSAVVVKRAVYTVNLRLQATAAGESQIVGTITGSAVNATVVADLSTFSKGVNLVPAALVGVYNVLLPTAAGTSDPNFPAGIGYGRIVVKRSGRTTFLGELGDGTSISTAGTLAGEPTQSLRYLPFFGALYGRTGSISGRLTFDLDKPEDDVSGLLEWYNAPGAGASDLQPLGFTGKVSLSGGKFTKGASGLLAFVQGPSGLGHLLVKAPAAGILPPLEATASCSLNADGTIAVLPSGGSSIGTGTLVVDSNTGLLSGDIREGGKVRKVAGIVVSRKLNKAGGLFLRKGQPGSIEITP